MTKEMLAHFEIKLCKIRKDVIDQEIDVSRMKSEKLIESYEAASLITDQNMITKLLRRKALYLRKIDAALERIKNDEYGDCEVCGEEINPKRLEARPTATYCIACKEAEEKNE